MEEPEATLSQKVIHRKLNLLQFVHTALTKLIRFQN